MLSVTPWGPITWPAQFYEEGGLCNVKLCFGEVCEGEAFAIGSLGIDNIQWDIRNSDNTWVRHTGDDACLRSGDWSYSCCRGDKLKCGLAPNKEVCDDVQGDFCCHPSLQIDCGHDPTETVDQQQLMI